MESITFNHPFHSLQLPCKEWPNLSGQINALVDLRPRQLGEVKGA